MRAFVVSLIAGMLAGIVYGLLQVRSPAPPMVALLGLLGMLVGEQVVPVCRRALNRQLFRSHVSRAIRCFSDA